VTVQRILGTTYLDNVFCLFADTNTQGALLYKEVHICSLFYNSNYTGSFLYINCQSVLSMMKELSIVMTNLEHMSNVGKRACRNCHMFNFFSVGNFLFHKYIMF
jgi:hypothetical protein